MKNCIFLIDFDKTITKVDSTDAVMEICNKELLLNYQNRFRQKEINIKEYLSGLLGSLTLTQGEYEKIISDNVEIDEKFIEFINLGYKFKIVSAGTYQNIYAVLNKYNIKIAKEDIYSNEAIFDKGKIIVKYPYDVDDCYEGVCKKTILQDYKKKYNKVIFIGDGSSDISASEYADILFVKKGYQLEKYCKENNLKHIVYENFGDIIKHIENN